MQVTSNGVATQTTKKAAITKAIFELFERDAFLMYWLTKCVPRQIDVESIDDEELNMIVSKLKSAKISTHLLDCRNEFGIPVVVLVSVDDVRGAVRVDAAAGFDLKQIIYKVFLDSLKWNINGANQIQAIEGDMISNMHERELYWSNGKNKDKINFLIEGKSISFKEYQESFKVQANVSEYEQILKIAKNHGLQMISYCHTDDLARSVGLEVYRVIIPELMPIYFNEVQPHHNVTRLSMFANNISQLSGDTVVNNKINITPHPFL